jgi:KamA family protein
MDLMLQEIAQSSKYRSYALHNYKTIPQVAQLSKELIEAIEVVGNVLPFKTNNYVVNELIDWDKVPDDPIFTLTFPRKEMLLPHHYQKMKATLDSGANKDEIKKIANEIRMELNPHPAGQDKNVPMLGDIKLTGIQHKYRETLLFFPSQGQTCHAYCSFCFRWPQFVGIEDLKFAMKETDLLVQYLKEHREVTDVLFTGGDPMIMKAKLFRTYVEALLDDELWNVQTIRIGTKSLGYWPYKFLTDDDADEMIEIFRMIVKKGKNLAIMAHFNHPVELSTDPVKEAVKRIRSTGAQIRSQSPILRSINDSARIWADMWREQVNQNIIPYYMFAVRDTGAQHFYGLPLVEAQEIWRKAYQMVSGVCRTVRGPSMSCTPGKVQILGTADAGGKKVMVMRFLQGRNPDWVGRPFFAEYNPDAVWLDELKPAFGEEKFFFEDELHEILNHKAEIAEIADEMVEDWDG